MDREFFRELWRYRELFYFFVWRDIKVRYKQTVLGASWAVIQPFFTMIVFTLFFGRLARMPSDGIPYPLFSYSALLPWTYFSGALSNAGNSLVGNANLLTKVYFPRMTIPASATISGLLDFGIAFVVLLGMMVYYRIQPTISLLLWPVLILTLLILAMGVGMILAALNVKYRDVKYAIPFVIQLWLFLTPIIYPTSIIPDRFRVLVAINPLSGIIEAFRASLIPTREIDWLMLGVSSLLALSIFSIGMVYFHKTEKRFADII
ncbi:MAG: ABC transporter permease [Thermodesulfobacteriota bacterium]|nr:ABC transporter permease [Thermodesulfobacteriota bacterium]